MKIFITFFSLTIVAFVSSCSPVLYSNTGHVVPLFQEKGEVMMNASWATTEDASGVAGHFATAVNNDWAFISSFYYLANGDDDDWDGHGSQFELGGGRFYTFGQKNRGVVEVFAGVGFGGIDNEFANERLNVGFIKPFIQPSIGVTGPWVDFAFTPRIAFVSYTSHTILIEDPEYRFDAERYFREKKNALVFEPGMIFRGGYKNIKGQLLINLSTFTADADADDLDPNINSQYFSLGINYLFSNRYR